MHATLATHCESISLRRGAFIFEEGDDAHHLFIIRSGRVAIANQSAEGRESVVALMESGDLFGEMGLFTQTGRSAGAKALEPTEIVRIPYAPILALYEEHPQELWHVVRLLTQRLRSMDLALADSFFLDITGRTAKRILELAGDQDVFEMPLTQEELASLVGASRERVNKAISSFLKLGWLEHHNDGYRIAKRKELEIRSS